MDGDVCVFCSDVIIGGSVVVHEPWAPGNGRVETRVHREPCAPLWLAWVAAREQSQMRAWFRDGAHVVVTRLEPGPEPGDVTLVLVEGEPLIVGAVALEGFD